MFSPPSLQRTYTLCSSLDPALDLPDVPELAEGAPAADVEARDKAIEQRNLKLRVARQTGNWHEITKAGQQPTMFHFKPIFGVALTWLKGECARRSLNEDERNELVFRLALDKVENFGKAKVTHDDPIDDVPNHRLASLEFIEQIYAVGRAAGRAELGRLIIYELGLVLLDRAVNGGVDPLS